MSAIYAQVCSTLSLAGSGSEPGSLLRPLPLTPVLISLVGEDGRVAGDEFGERDTRFSYILVSALSLLGRLDALEAVHGGKGRELVLSNIVRSMNFDGAFGAEPGAESHGAQGESVTLACPVHSSLTAVWVCVAALAILGELDRVDRDLLGWWLSERQLPNGGLNGRPEKLEDVCYSWWNLAALSIIGKLHWINRDKLIAFILAAQVWLGDWRLLTSGRGGRGYRRPAGRLGRRVPHCLWAGRAVAARIPWLGGRGPAVLHAGRGDRRARPEKGVHYSATARGVAITVYRECIIALYGRAVIEGSYSWYARCGSAAGVRRG